MSKKTYTLIVRWKSHKAEKTSLFTCLDQEEGQKFYSDYVEWNALIWAKLINNQTGRVWKESTGEAAQ